MGYIYKIINAANGKVYIGQTARTLQERYKEHLKHAASRDSDNRFLYKAMNKYGYDNFRIALIEEVDDDKLSEREIYYISLYKADQRRFGYNMTAGGGGIASLPPTIEKLRATKISDALKGRKQSAESVEKRAGKLRGQKRTPEQKQRIGASLRGKHHKGTPCSEETKQKLRQRNLGKKQSKATKEKRAKSMHELR